MTDQYQARYVAHQLRKKETLIKIIKKRHSDRIFGEGQIPDETIVLLHDSLMLCPSSCDRKAVKIVPVDDRDRKALLGGILVGGVGWVHRASHILLIFADPIAYKAGNEIEFMPYLDAGVVIEQLYLLATALNLKCSFVNPNIREVNRSHFKTVFGDKIFCGAFAIGFPE